MDVAHALPLSRGSVGSKAQLLIGVCIRNDRDKL